MDIRKFRPEDRQQKRELHLETIRKTNSRDYSEEEIDAWTSFDPDNSVPEGKIERWVAEQDGEITGFADYMPDKNTVTGVYVHPDHLRKGIGTALLETIIDDARDRGLEYLECESSRTAREFYRSNGFHVMEETIHRTSGEELDAFRMRKQL